MRQPRRARSMAFWTAAASDTCTVCFDDHPALSLSAADEGGDLARPILEHGIRVHDHRRSMYPREAVARLAGLVRSGLLDLRHYDVASFELEAVNEAVAHAAAHAGPFRMTVVRP